MQTALQVMNIPIYEKAVSVWGTYGNDFFRFRHIFLSQLYAKVSIPDICLIQANKARHIMSVTFHFNEALPNTGRVLNTGRRTKPLRGG
jgi:hypothetical protein